MKSRRLAIVATLLVSSSACTQIVVKRIQNDSTDQGLRYYLPQPFLLVTPQEDGSLTTTVVNIADPQQAYGVSARSWLAVHDLSVELNQGLLAKVTLSVDDTAVAAAAATAAGEVEKAKIDAEVKAAETARTEAKERAKADRERREKLRQSLREAEVKRDDAKRKQDAITAIPEGQRTAEQKAALFQAKLDYEAAQADVSYYENELGRRPGKPERPDRVVQDLTIEKDRSATASSTKSKEFERENRPGAMLFRVVTGTKTDEKGKTHETLELVPVAFPGAEGQGALAQQTFKSYTGPKVAASAPAPAAVTRIAVTPGTFTVKVGPQGGELTITTYDGFVGVKVTRVTNVSDPSDTIAPGLFPEVSVPDKENLTEFKLKFAGNTLAGKTLKILLQGQVADDPKKSTVTGDITVEVKR